MVEGWSEGVEGGMDVGNEEREGGVNRIAEGTAGGE